jgi:hypothetical protein
MRIKNNYFILISLLLIAFISCKKANNSNEKVTYKVRDSIPKMETIGLEDRDTNFNYCISNFILYISNQSLTIDTVDIKVYIDGKLVINEDFDVYGKAPGHNWKTFYFRFSKGIHKLKVESKKGGATFKKEFHIKNRHWVVIDYTNKGFIFDISNKPIYFM